MSAKKQPTGKDGRTTRPSAKAAKENDPKSPLHKPMSLNARARRGRAGRSR